MAESPCKLGTGGEFIRCDWIIRRAMDRIIQQAIYSTLMLIDDL